MRKRIPPIPSKGPVSANGPKSILELDRFSHASLQKWKSVSQDLNELQDTLHFGPEPERRRLRSELISALQCIPESTIDLSQWVRFVTYKYSLEPLSCAGSLQYIGGRFNAGAELDSNTLNPWPALYLAEDYETAFREKFQLRSDELVDGLSPQELALQQGGSHTVVILRGHLSRVFDMTSVHALAPIAKVLRQIKMPARARQIQRSLKIPDNGIFMMRTGKQLHDAALRPNWRVLPIQFGLPAPSQILADLIRAADFEAILYQSTKGPGKCLVVYPDRLQDGSFVELIDDAPSACKYRRLDEDSAADLEGWESLPRQLRSR